MKKRTKSVVVKLSIKFSSILTVAVLTIIFIFFMFLQVFNRQQETRAYRGTISSISRIVKMGNEQALDQRLSSVPFFISYLIYDTNTKEVIRKKNDQMGILPITGDKPKHYTAKSTDSQSPAINIIYITSQVETINGRNITIQISANARNEGADKFTLRLLTYIGLATVPILIISFLLSLYITKQTMKPVVQITDAAKSISSTNLSTLLPETGKQDELDNLAQTFNRLFSRLKIDFERERSFTSNVSHELKTPVAVILGQANLLRRWGKDDPKQLEKSIGTILNESRSMEAIISNLLQLSRLESGKIQPEFSVFSLDEQINRIIHEFSLVSPDSDFTWESEDKDLNLTSDAELFHQLLTIVIQNSIKFTAKNIKIKISSKKIIDPKTGKDFISVSIEDNGPGFEEDVIPHVFERFYRGDSAHVRAAGGSGLGLSIARAITDSLNGTITAANSPSHGALITVSLPA